MSEVDGLDVYLHGAIAGVLERRSQARLRFTYNEAWVEGEGAPLSLGLPVRSQSYDHDECAPFFEGLLPEGDFLKAIARTLHVSATNPFQLLTELGGECAGAISVAPTGGPEPGQDPRPPRWLSERELGALLKDLPKRPLIAAIDEVEDGGGFRLSLAGAQDKVGVLVEKGRIGLSHGRPPTTAILKAPIPHVAESVVNEAFCMGLAAHVDLDVAAAAPHIADSQEYLLVHRYDRGGDAPDGRIHQEDFCQALGLVPAVKYEREGGPTIADCAALIRRHCSAPARDLMAFLDALLFNFVIANHDAHSKNYSLLLDGPRAIRLAPLYDLLCTVAVNGTDRKLAMRYGGENRPKYLRGRHLDRLARDLGVKPVLVRRRAIAMRERVEAAIEAARRSLPAEFQGRPMLDRMIEVIGERCETLAERAREASEPVEEAPVEDLAQWVAEFRGLAGAVTQGFANFNKSIDWVTTLLGGDGDVDFEQLGKAALELKQYGRETYDAVAELDAEVLGLLDGIEQQDGGEPADLELLASLAQLSEGVEGGVELLESSRSVTAELARQSAPFREPMRSMRAGLHDMLDARKIIREWGRRAEAVRPTPETVPDPE